MASCKRKCADKFSEDNQANIHKSFWVVESKIRRRDFVGSHVAVVPNAKERAIGSQKKMTYQYSLPLNNTNQRVL